MSEEIKLDEPFRYGTQTGAYPFVLTKTLRAHLTAPWANVPHQHTFLFNGRILGTLHKGTLFIFAKYAIDGATRAPDPSEGMLKFFLHDFFYQFLKTIACPWNRKQADSVFLMTTPPPHFQQSKLYYLGVRLGGWAFARKHIATYIRIEKTYTNDDDFDSHDDRTYQEA